MEEQTVAKPPVRYGKRIGIILGIIVVLAVVAYIAIFHWNQFSLAVEFYGEEDIPVSYGTEYQDPGAKAVLYGSFFWKQGIELKDVAVNIRGDVQTDKIGRYELVYEAAYKGMSAEKTRMVRVVDTESPVITLTKTSVESILPGTLYEEDGYQAIDNHDGDITDKVVRIEEFGVVKYAVFDSSGNPAFAERVIPYYDPIPPEIHLEQGEHITILVGTIYEEPGFSASDNVDGDLTEKVSTEGDDVLWYQPGTYSRSYTVSDGFENVTTVCRTIEVVAQERPEVVYPDGNIIYLTFDDGPGPYTDQLLDVLNHYGVKATFFVTDSGYNNTLKKIVDHGHSIGIHTVTHDYNAIYSSPEAYFRDLTRMQSIIYENTGITTTLMRFPGGSSNLVSSFNEGIMSTLTEAVQDAGFQYFDWNVDSDDAGRARDTETVFDNVITGVQRQRISVVLQHDIHPYSIDAVEEIILWGLDNGYTFLPLEANSPNMHHTVQN